VIVNDLEIDYIRKTTLKMRIRYLICLSLAVVTLAIFWQIRNHEFVWSDRSTIAENLYLNRRAPSNANAFWQRPLSGPLTHTVWDAVAGLSENPTGDPRQRIEPRPFHIANLLIHILSVLIVFAILRMLIRDDWAAGAGALLFALHPLHVEPVAWASGMMHLLGGFLALVALWQYLLYVASVYAFPKQSDNLRSSAIEWQRTRRERVHYAVATCAFALALLANPVAVAALLVAWFLDYGLFERALRQSVNSLGPWLALALVFTAVTLWLHPVTLSVVVVPLWQRPLIAADALAFYLYKLFVPFGLSVDYGRSPAAVVQQGWIYFTWLVPAVLGLFLWLWRRRAPHVIIAAGIFAASLLPVLGFLPFGFQRISTVADRYLYLALLGPALVLAWAVSRWKSKPVLVACGILLAALGLKSAFQARLWKNNITLFSHALELNPNSWVSHYNLGLGLAQKGTLEDAGQHYRAALKIKPDYGRARYALGNVLATQGNFDEAIEQYRKVLSAGTRTTDVHYYLGNVFAKLNRLTEAAEQYDESLQINPQNAAAHGSLGHILFRQRKLEDAMAHYRKALEIEPEAADVHYGLANILASRGELDEAMNHYQTALRINPSYAGAYYNLGTILARRGQLEEAIRYFRQALKVRPNFADAHESLGRALVLQGNREEGLQHIEQALRILKIGGGTETSP
jgi:tetratricopeptide (TPR) repeat protein